MGRLKYDAQIAAKISYIRKHDYLRAYYFTQNIMIYNLDYKWPHSYNVPMLAALMN